MENRASNVATEQISMGGLVNLTLTPATGSRIRNVSKLSYKSTGHVEGSYRKFVGDQMDEYLESMGMVRRSLPGRLEETLFRAVSELIYHSQTSEEVWAVERCVRDHLEMTKKSRAVENGSPWPNDPFDLVKSAATYYNLTVVMYMLPNQPPYIIAPVRLTSDDSSKLYLYNMGHKYDYIYPMAKHESLAVAQGILYDDLYCKVFGFKKDDIDAIVKRVRRDAAASGEVRICSTTTNMGTEKEHVAPECLTIMPTGWPIIPFGAAKSIDPGIYRNVPFDLANKALKLQRKEGQVPYRVKFPPESHCLARRNDKFVFATIVEVVDFEVRVVRFLDNTQTRLKTSDLRGRGMLYNGQSRYAAANQSSEWNYPVPQIDCSVPPPPLHCNSMPISYPSHQSQVADPLSPVIIPAVPMQLWLPPTYYVGQYQISSPITIDQYFKPDSMQQSALLNTNSGQMSSTSYAHQQWAPMNQYMPNELGSYDEHLTPPKSSTGSSVSQKTVFRSCRINEYNVPHITREQFNLVNKAARFSVNGNGDDLPSDENTLRYFFNLGLAAYQNGVHESSTDSQNVGGNSYIGGPNSEATATNNGSMVNGSIVTIPYPDDLSAGIEHMSPQIPLFCSSGFYPPQLSPGVYSMISSPSYTNRWNDQQFFP